MILSLLRHLLVISMSMLVISSALVASTTFNHGTIDSVKIVYSVTIDEIDDQVVLQIKLKNNSKNSYYIRGSELPWITSAGVRVYITPSFFVPPEQNWETEYLPNEHFAGLPTFVLNPGIEKSGTYKLFLYYDKIASHRNKGSIGINWNLSLKLQNQDPYKSQGTTPQETKRAIETVWIGGFLILPESRK